MANEKKWAVMGGIALNVEYTRKYGFEATAAARVTAKLVAVPPPSVFQQAVQANIAGRLQRAEQLARPKPPPLLPDKKLPNDRLPDITRPRDPDRPSVLPPSDNDEDAAVDIGWIDNNTAAIDDDDSDFSTVSLIFEDMPHASYVFDDGVVTPTSGVTDEDGALHHRVSKASDYCVLSFEDGTRVEFPVVHDDADDSANLAIERDDDFDLDENDLEEDDNEWPVLSLLISGHPDSTYTLDDGISQPSEGTTSNEGLLVHPIAPGATRCSIQFGDDYLIQLPIQQDSEDD